MLKIKSCWRYAAMDSSGTIYMFMTRPHISDPVWSASYEGPSEYERINDIFDIDWSHLDWKDSLHYIDGDGEFHQVIDFKRDEPVMVSDDNHEWIPRYFARYIEGTKTFECYHDGCTSFTARKGCTIVPWAYCRRPTEKELNRD